MKILILGSARHGKDSVAEMLKSNYGFTFSSSSKAALNIFLFDLLNTKYGKNYKSKEEAFEDRKSQVMRDIWYEEISNYNKDNKTRLAEDILKSYDIYVGMRSFEEIEACKKKGLFDLILGVYNPSIPMESTSSNSIDLLKHCDIIISNNGTLKDLNNKVISINYNEYSKDKQKNNQVSI